MTRPHALPVVVAALMGSASAGGLLVRGIYRDNALVAAGWLGNDVVTLVLAVPLLVLGAAWARAHSPRGLLVCLGLLAYAAYNYAFYLFGAAFNALFLVYVAILALSTVGLIARLASAEVREVVARVTPDRTARWVGGAVVAISAVLGAFWVALSLGYVVTGSVPSMVTATDHPTNVTGALDLWLVVTFGLWGGTWLAMGRAWGFLITAVWTLKGAVYMTALSAASYTAYRSGAAAGLAQLALWIPIGVVCAVGAVLLLRRVDRAGLRPRRPRAAPPASG
jgi:hypothetical protein